VKGAARSGIPVAAVMPATASTALDSASAEASTASFDGRPASAAASAASPFCRSREQPLRRGGIDFRHEDVECERGGLVAMNRFDQLGHDAARPRPLADRFQALLVDLDHHGWLGLGLARGEGLARVEPRGPQA
jgi:hypothetical protein